MANTLTNLLRLLYIASPIWIIHLYKFLSAISDRRFQDTSAAFSSIIAASRRN